MDTSASKLDELPAKPTSPHIVVLGAGFGGLTFCQQFSFAEARVTLVDRQNHHLFQPLLYQVATGGLGATEIAQPVRSILSEARNVTVLMDQVVEINLAKKRVELAGAALKYDYLVMALGGVTSYFGHPEWEEFAPGLKSIDDALFIRRRILLAFEEAENEIDPARRNQLLTMVVVGGGPTGVELAGALAELARFVLNQDFRRIDPAKAKICLIEAAPRIMGQFPESLSASAVDQLTHLGVEIRVNCRVKSITEGRVELENGVIHAQTIIWAAGVGASPLTRQLGVELDRAGRVRVNPDLSLPGHPEVFALGDMAVINDESGQQVPGVAPAAMQMARHAANIIRDELTYGPDKERPPFRYRDKGTMATIGRSAAVAKVGNLEFSGFFAWLAWLFVHLVFLIGLKNKIFVFLQWVYSYFTYRRGARIITGLQQKKRVPPTFSQP